MSILSRFGRQYVVPCSVVFVLFVAVCICGLLEKQWPGEVFGLPSTGDQDYQFSFLAQPIPSWIKSDTDMWAHGHLDDSQFVLGIRYLIANDILPLPHEYAAYLLQKPIPQWVRTLGSWWSEGKVSDYEFAACMQYMIASGEISLGPGGVQSDGQDSSILRNNFREGTVKLDGKVLEVQVADTPERMTEGLQFQDSMPYDQGMIFVFQEPQQVAMWMKDMRFPLDIIWFDDSGGVVHLEKNLPPCDSISPCPIYNDGGQETKYVLEVTGGFVDIFNITNKSRLVLTGISP